MSSNRKKLFGTGGAVGALLLLLGVCSMTHEWRSCRVVQQPNEPMQPMQQMEPMQHVEPMQKLEPIQPMQAWLTNKTLLRDENDTLLVPDDEVLKTMDNDQLIDLWWSYIHTLQVMCRNQVRVGFLIDGGKEVCIDLEYQPTTNSCLVYSIGSAMQFDFEEAVKSRYNCEIHVFDPTRGYTDEDKKRIPKTVFYHTIGLYKYNGQKTIKKKKTNWEVMTLSSMLTTFGHLGAALDILKVDIEHSEWDVIPEIIKSGVHRQVKQLQLEVHFRVKDTMKALRSLRMLYHNGFRIFMRDRNIFGCIVKHQGKSITRCNELSFINICYRQKC